MLRVLQFLTIMLTALALVPSGAHLFALPNKIGLTQDAYFTVQGIYYGWALFGFLWAGALIANLAQAIALRAQGEAFWLALAAFLCTVAMFAIFFIWTYPANVATENWSKVPANWIELRRQWEYSHALNALVTFAAFCCATLAVLTSRGRA